MARTGHSGLDQYLAYNRLAEGEARVDGAVVLVFDERYRVYCRPAQHGDVVFEAKLADMPDDGARGDRLLHQALELAGEQLEDAAEVPVLSEDERALQLQRRVGADANVGEVERALESFMNAIGVWRRRLYVL